MSKAFLHTGTIGRIKYKSRQNPAYENLANLFTKSLPTFSFRKLVHEIEMRQLKDFLETSSISISRGRINA